MMIDNHHNHSAINSQLLLPPLKKKKRKKIKTPNIFKFETLNINHLTDYKKNTLFEILKDNKIQILGLAEMHLNEKQAKHYFKKFKDDYTFYHSIDKEHIKSTGVGIITRNDLNLRVINSDSYRR
jgi:exonuclease III